MQREVCERDNNPTKKQKTTHGYQWVFNPVRKPRFQLAHKLFQRNEHHTNLNSETYKWNQILKSQHKTNKGYKK